MVLGRYTRGEGVLEPIKHKLQLFYVIRRLAGEFKYLFFTGDLKPPQYPRVAGDLPE